MALLTQRFPTAKVCGISIFIWSIIVMSTSACTTYAGLVVNRFFLGVTESCIAPAFTVYITFWWTRREQPFRSSLWYGMTGGALTITPLINWGLGHIHGSFGMSTWKYMYLVAGAVTMVWSLVVIVVLPGKPSTECRSKLANRISRDGQMIPTALNGSTSATAPSSLRGSRKTTLELWTVTSRKSKPGRA